VSPDLFFRRKRDWVRWLVWIGAVVVLLPWAPHVEDGLEVSARILGSESARVEALLEESFESPFAHSALLVVAGAPDPRTPRGSELLRAVVETFVARPEVTGTFSFLDQPDSFFVGQGGTGTFLVVGLEAPDGRVDRLLPGLRVATGTLESRLRQDFPDVTLRWTGEAAINHDLWRAGADQTSAGERHALPLTLGLLLLAFASIVAAALPVAAGVLSVALALGLVGWVSSVWPLSLLAVNVVSMLGLALGIDYALFMVTRFREARAAGQAPAAASRETARRAGGTVALSGAAVTIGFLALLAVPFRELRSAALGGLFVVLVSVAVAVDLLPSVLSWLGPRLEWGRLWRVRPSTDRRWRAWSTFVCAHPGLVLVLAGAPLLLLAAQALRLNPGIPSGNWLPPRIEAARALDDLRAMGRSGVVHTLRIVLELPETTTALEREGWDAQARLQGWLLSDPRVSRVQSLRTVAGERADDLAWVSLLPSVAKRSFIDGLGEVVLLEAVPREGVDPTELAAYARELRSADVASVTGLAGARLRVGGLPAFNADYEDAVAGRIAAVVALVVGVTLLVLLVAFRSVLVPLKAVALNLFAVWGAFGALVLVFQDGWGLRWLGLDAPLDGVFPVVPPLVFCIVFGLSMDYEVFLVSRVAEARRSGMSEEDALAEGLARTGRVITSAAAIMIAVFAAFTLGDFVLVKMLGFTLAVAVLLDATIIRVAIGPALLRLAGRWNWWPGA
jgi:RND superfamily putative drug exporter